MLISDNALNASLEYIMNNATELHVCSQEPTTLVEANFTYSLGYKTAPTITGPTTNPNAILINEFTDGLGTGTGIVYFWALVSGFELLATAPLLDPVNIVNQKYFGFPDFTFECTFTLQE